MRATARIELGHAVGAGLTMPLPSPCRSLLLRVEQHLDGEDNPHLGVQITTASGEPLSPGNTGVAVQLDFWADLADVLVVPGARFTLRYPIRVVGSGEVVDVLTL